MRYPFIHLVLAVIVCAALLGGYGVWYATVSAKSTAVTKLQNKITTKTATMNRLASTRAAFAEMSGDEAVVQGYFVPETKVVPFIDSLEVRGNSLGAEVKVLSVSTSDSSTLALSLSVGGDFDAVMRTVGAIEYAPYDISISSLLVNRDASGGWHADLKLSVGSIPEVVAPPSTATGTRTQLP